MHVIHTPSTTEKRVVLVCVSRGLKPAQRENRTETCFHTESLFFTLHAKCALRNAGGQAGGILLRRQRHTHWRCSGEGEGRHLAAPEVDCGGGGEEGSLVVEAAFDCIDTQDDDAGSESDDYGWRLGEKEVPELNDLNERQLVGEQSENPADLNKQLKS